jgi:hypothetical protein
MESLSRRAFFRIGLTAATAGSAVLTLTACGKNQAGADAAACADPNDMSPSDTSLRQANAYVEKSANSAKTCGGCTFFTAAADGGACGTCQIFTGAPANRGGFCNSWAAKPGAPAAGAGT